MKRIVGIDRATTDAIFVIPRSEHPLLCQKLGFPADRAVAQLPREIMEHVFETISRDYCPIIAAGGNVHNCLASLAGHHIVNRVPADLECILSGTGPPDLCGSSPADQLRACCVRITPLNARTTRRLSICLISQEDGSKLGILVEKNDLPLGPLPVIGKADLIIVAAYEAAGEAAQISFDTEAHVAVLVTGTENAAQIQAICSQRASGPRTLFCNRAEYRQLFGQDCDAAQAGTRYEWEIVVTDGPSFCWVKSPTSDFERYQHASADCRHGRVALGCGDAFAGGWLSARMMGRSIVDAVAAGAKSATEVLALPSAHASAEIDLNVVFGWRIDRQSPSNDEGSRFWRFRQTPGLAVICCGQTGVDQMALNSAAYLGITAFANLPLGGRTEYTEGMSPEADDFGAAIRIELASPSYRYCTWANVYFSDATLIHDIAESEGSRETRRACRDMNRPFLDVGRLAGESLASAVLQFVLAHDVRVLNVAGNRARLMSSDMSDAARKKIDQCLRIAAWAREQLTRGRTHDKIRADLAWDAPRPAGYNGLRLLAPKREGVRRLLADFLRTAHGAAPATNSKRAYDHFESLGLHVFYLKSRDIPRMMRAGHANLALCGSDMLIEEGEDAFDVQLWSGLHACSLALLQTTSEQPIKGLLSQYPNLAIRTTELLGLPAESVTPLVGAAEGAAHLIDQHGLIDTWQTGESARANGLSMTRQLHHTCLVVAMRAGTNPSPDVRSFTSAFRAWLLSNRADPPQE